MKQASFHYKYSFEFGSNKTRLLQPIVIIPVLAKSLEDTIIPSNKIIKFNNHTKLTIQINDKNYIDDDEDDIHVGFRQSLNRGMGNNNESTEDLNAKITVRQSVNETDQITNATDVEGGKNKTEKVEITTLPTGVYPKTNNSREENNLISFTTAAPDANLPPANDSRWQNFTMDFGNETTIKPITSANKGPYSAALYNNGMIDQISITTNSYTNEESPLPSPKDDRWRTFSQKTQSANEFRPLAGLYYDGFLHKPLIMLPGFIPRKYYDFYHATR